MPRKHCLLLNNLIASKFQYATLPHANIVQKIKIKSQSANFFLIGPILISAEISKIEINKFGSVWHSSCQCWIVMHLC